MQEEEKILGTLNIGSVKWVGANGPEKVFFFFFSFLFSFLFLFLFLFFLIPFLSFYLKKYRKKISLFLGCIPRKKNPQRKFRPPKLLKMSYMIQKRLFSIWRKCCKKKTNK